MMAVMIFSPCLMTGLTFNTLILLLFLMRTQMTQGNWQTVNSGPVTISLHERSHYHIMLWSSFNCFYKGFVRPLEVLDSCWYKVNSRLDVIWCIGSGTMVLMCFHEAKVPCDWTMLVLIIGGTLSAVSISFFHPCDPDDCNYRPSSNCNL